MVRRRRDDAGQSVAVLLLLVLALFAAGLTLLGLGEASDVRAKAQKSADAGALAAPFALATSWWRRCSVRPEHASARGRSGPGRRRPGARVAAGYVAANSRSIFLGCAYRPAGQVRVDTSSAPGGERGLVGSATATADINGPVCTSVYYYVGKTAFRTITCTGRDGSAFATFNLDTQSLVASSSPQQWRATFRVRLID